MTRTGNWGFLVFSKENGQLLDHPITRGRNEVEQLKKITTFTGQSLKPPRGSVSFLKRGTVKIEAKGTAVCSESGKFFDTDSSPVWTDRVLNPCHVATTAEAVRGRLTVPNIESRCNQLKLGHPRLVICPWLG
jgi:hypothetical protein